MSLIDTLRTVALKLQWIKSLAVVLVVFSIVAFFMLILNPSVARYSDDLLLPSVMLLLWALLLCAFVYTFPHVPETADKTMNFFRRMMVRIKRCYYVLLAVMCGLTTIGIIFVSVRLIRVWLYASQ